MVPSASLKRSLVGLAGQGSILDAETVTTVAKNVKPKREETKVRFWASRNTRLVEKFMTAV